MKRYYRRLDGKTLMSLEYKSGWRVINFNTKQEDYNGANVDNIVWEEDGTPRLKNEQEYVQDKWAMKSKQMENEGLLYMDKQGYTQPILARMTIFLINGTQAQKDLCTQVLAFSDLVQGRYFEKVAEMQACETLEAIEVLRPNYAELDSQDPKISIFDVQQAGA